MLLGALEQTLLSSILDPLPPMARAVGPGAGSGDVNRMRPTDITMPALPSDFLSSMCDVQDRIPRVSRFSEDSGYIHVSSLVNLCPRQYALARQHNAVVSSSPAGAMRIVWEIGVALERHVIAQVARYHSPNFVLTGYELRDEEYRVVGRPDLMVQVLEGVLVVAEIKTMNARDWEALEEPLADHVLQAALYCWLLSRSNIMYDSQGVRRDIVEPFRVHDKLVLIYVAKDYMRGSPYKEFHVDVSNHTVMSMMDLALDLAVELRDATDRDGLPARRLCPRQDCTKARSCPVATLCFNLPGDAT